MGYFLVAACGLLIAVASLVQHRLTVVAHRLSCSEACGIFLGQGLNQCLLHWQDPLPLNHQESPDSLLSVNSSIRGLVSSLSP